MYRVPLEAAGGQRITACWRFLTEKHSLLPSSHPQPPVLCSSLPPQFLHSFNKSSPLRPSVIYHHRQLLTTTRNCIAMAHPNPPSLMDRLFPQEDPPAGQMSSSDDLSSSTLLGLLSSPGIYSAIKAPFLSSSSRDEQLRSNDLYRACFSTFSNDAIKSKAQEQKAAEADSLEQLKGSYQAKAEYLSSTLNQTWSLCRSICPGRRRTVHLGSRKVGRGQARDDV